MPILREIAARIGLQLDKKSFAEADKRTKSVVTTLNKAGRVADTRAAQSVAAVGGVQTAASAGLGALGRFFGGAAIGFGALKLVKLGSDANETLNVLNASFGENTQAVTNWAAAFANNAGRSEFAMREMSGTLGAILNPLMERNQKVAADMSMRLSELAVDLGSFFNAAEPDVLTALRAGIVGETEPLKRFGIVMQEATLEAFRLEQGIKTSVKEMSIAEKTALRYNFILDQTQLAHGDAAKTSEGWANASKAMTSTLKDLGTRIGLTILPFAEKVVIVTRDALRAFLDWQKGTQFLKAALIVLGAVGAKIALGLIIAWAPVILPILKFVAIATIAALILEDFLTLMAGGDSVIGRFIDSIFGPGSATAAVNSLKEAWEGLKLFWANEVLPAIDTLKKVLGLFFDDVKLGLDTLKNAFSETFGFIGKIIDKARDFLNIEVDLGGRDYNVAQTRGLQTQTRTAPVAPTVGGAVDASSSTTVIVQGSATAKDAARIADASGEAQRKANRRTRAALTQRAEG